MYNQFATLSTEHVILYMDEIIEVLNNRYDRMIHWYRIPFIICIFTKIMP